MRRNLLFASTTFILALGVYACQVESPTALDLDDPSFGGGRYGKMKMCHRDQHGGHGEYDEHGEYDKHGRYNEHGEYGGHGGYDGYRAIRINAKDQDSHRSHGDGKVGDWVPGKRRHRFDRHCKPKQDNNGHDGVLTVVKVADAAGTFAFEGSPYLGPFTLETGDSAISEITFDELETDDYYTIVEFANPDFVFVGASCTLENGEATGMPDSVGVTGIEVEHGKTTTCTFENVQLQAAIGTLNVVKISDAPGTFNFEGTPTIGSFSLTTIDSMPAAQLFEALDAQVVYSVSEIVDPGFTLASASCVLEDGTVTGTADSTGVSGVVIEDGKTTTCSFVNEEVVVQPQVGSLNVIKTSDSTAAFAFMGSATIGAFTLNTGDSATSSQLFENLDAQITYAVVEEPNAAFILASAACTLADGTPTGTLDTLAINGIVIQPGLTTTCTFNNTVVQPDVGSLRIVKTSDSVGSFVFQGSAPIGTFALATDDPVFAERTFADLPTQVSYSISETLTPNFDLTSVACTLEDGTATGVVDTLGVSGVQVQPGLTTTCTFVNTFIQPVVTQLRVIKQTDAPGTFVFDGTPSIGQFTLNTADSITSEATFDIADVTVTYTISETLNPAFDFNSATCTLETGEPTGTTAGTGVTGVQVVLGQTTTCVFMNTSRPVGPPSGELRLQRDSG